MISLIAGATNPMAGNLSELELKVQRLWNTNDDGNRIEFVKWVNENQSFNGLSIRDVKKLMGAPTGKFDNPEAPYNGLKLGEELREDQQKPLKWIYQSLRKGSNESQYWGREGSGYLLDLEIHFNIHGKVYGAGTTQFVTGSEYYELLTNHSTGRPQAGAG